MKSIQRCVVLFVAFAMLFAVACGRSSEAPSAVSTESTVLKTTVPATSVASATTTGSIKSTTGAPSSEAPSAVSTESTVLETTVSTTSAAPATTTGSIESTPTESTATSTPSRNPVKENDGAWSKTLPEREEQQFKLSVAGEEVLMTFAEATVEQAGGEWTFWRYTGQTTSATEIVCQVVIPEEGRSDAVVLKKQLYSVIDNRPHDIAFIKEEEKDDVVAFVVAQLRATGFDLSVDTSEVLRSVYLMHSGTQERSNSAVLNVPLSSEDRIICHVRKSNGQFYLAKWNVMPNKESGSPFFQAYACPDLIHWV